MSKALVEKSIGYVGRERLACSAASYWARQVAALVRVGLLAVGLLPVATVMLVGSRAYAQVVKSLASIESEADSAAGPSAAGHSGVRAVLIGPRTDDSAKGLWDVIGSRLPTNAEREWFASAEDARRGSLVRYPTLSKPAAFLCINSRCSVALFTPQELRLRIDDMLQKNR
jgi:hypothetical protein